MGLSEMQSLFVSKLFSGQLTLPEKAVRDEAIAQEKLFQALIFSETTNRIEGLVNFQSYMDDLASLAGVRPNYWNFSGKPDQNGIMPFPRLTTIVSFYCTTKSFMTKYLDDTEPIMAII